MSATVTPPSVRGWGVDRIEAMGHHEETVGTGRRPSDETLIGRAEIDDVEAILALTNTDTTSTHHDVRSDFDTVFTWDYERSRPNLGRLYEKAKAAQWNAT